MRYIDEVRISNKRILLRVDYNISQNPDHTLANDERIKQSLPTIKYLLNERCKLIIISHLGRPNGYDENLSLKPVANDLERLLDNVKVELITDFRNNKDVFSNQTENEILLLENIRFFPEEESCDMSFAKELSELGEVFVNDAFSASHRKSASIIGIPNFLPSFAGLLMRKEVEMLKKLIMNPKKPFIAILGGSKVSTKINLISKLTAIADYILLGGGIANSFFANEGKEVGRSLHEKDLIETVQNLRQVAEDNNSEIVLPSDVVVIHKPLSVKNADKIVKSINSLSPDDAIYDIGPETNLRFSSIIESGKTIIWNGPVGYFEDQRFRRGTDQIFNAISQNSNAFSIIGGGETLTAIAGKENLSKISHISTGGGAMLEFIENGTLPGIAALDNAAITI